MVGIGTVTDGGVVVTYTVAPHRSAPPAVTTTVPLAVPAPPPAVTHQALPLTGAPLTLELLGAFGLLVVGAATARWSHRRPRAGGGR